VTQYQVPNNEEVFAVSTLAPAVAAGAGSQVFLWDTRQSAATPAKLLDSHTQDVNTVRFRPSPPHYLYSGSVDETICAFDITQPADEELLGTLQVEQSVAKLGFYGPQNAQLYCLTQTETLSLWDLNDESRLCNFDSIRAVSATPSPLDYLIDCTYDIATDRLLLFAGTFSGDVSVLQLSSHGVVPMLALRSGHNEVVRSCRWHSPSGTAVTGGEDGRLCLWGNAAAAPAVAPAISGPSSAAAAAAAASSSHDDAAAVTAEEAEQVEALRRTAMLVLNNTLSHLSYLAAELTAASCTAEAALHLARIASLLRKLMEGAVLAADWRDLVSPPAAAVQLQTERDMQQLLSLSASVFERCVAFLYDRRTALQQARRTNEAYAMSVTISGFAKVAESYFLQRE